MWLEISPQNCSSTFSKWKPNSHLISFLFFTRLGTWQQVDKIYRKIYTNVKDDPNSRLFIMQEINVHIIQTGQSSWGLSGVALGDTRQKCVQWFLIEPACSNLTSNALSLHHTLGWIKIICAFKKDLFIKTMQCFFQRKKLFNYFCVFSFGKCNAHYCEFFYHCASVPPPSKSD